MTPAELARFVSVIDDAQQMIADMQAEYRALVTGQIRIHADTTPAEVEADLRQAYSEAVDLLNETLADIGREPISPCFMPLEAELMKAGHA